MGADAFGAQPLCGRMLRCRAARIAPQVVEALERHRSTSPGATGVGQQLEDVPALSCFTLCRSHLVPAEDRCAANRRALVDERPCTW